MAVVTLTRSPGEPEPARDRDPANAAVGPGGYSSPAGIAPKVLAFREDDIRSPGISERGS